MANVTRTINTAPSKVFFVDMLTRDLSLTDAILDLADNSIDKYISITGLDATQAVLAPIEATQDEAAGNGAHHPTAPTINIQYDDNHFTIEDTSGGMLKNDIEQRVFVLGNPHATTTTPGLSVYGIGMKRAFFKLGNHVELITKSETDGVLAVVWDIAEWKGNPNEWKLPFADASTLALRRTLTETGTTIRVTNLHPEVKQAFNRVSFHNDLRLRLQTVYAAFIAGGVTIKLKDNDIAAILPEFGVSEELGTAHYQFEVDDVKVDIYVGVTAWTDKIPRGWYVFCNGRMVVSANKDQLTGWGDDFRVFHPKYNHFLGFVFMQSNNLLALPWTTTKQGVIREAHVYQEALKEMKLQARPVLDFFDERMARDEDGEITQERTMLQDLTPVPLFQAPVQRVFTPRPTAVPPTSTISYRKTQDEIRRAKEAFGNPYMSNRQLGEDTFDYFLENEE